MKTVNVAIMGIGTVGFGTYEIIQKNGGHIKDTHGVDIKVAKVLDREVDIITARGIDKKVACTSIDDICADKSISIVVETMGGVEPAKTFITKALQSGKNIVTANKELLGKHWSELEAVAKKAGVGIYFEASSVGGVPVIRVLQESMQANKINTIMGIINGTTNYILTKMAEEGLDYASVLKDAQDLGFAEANPSADVDGYDAMYKLSILSSLGFNTSIPITEIYREGITGISAQDMESAKELGYCIKLLAIGKRVGDKIEARVHPTFVPLAHPLASVRNEFNAVFLNGDQVDDIMLYGRGAGSYPTGSAIVSDVVYCANRIEPVYGAFKNEGKVEKGITMVTDFMSRYYLSFSVEDKAGVLAKITEVLGKHNVSVTKVIQKDCDREGVVSIMFLTHTTSEHAIQKAVKDINQSKDVKSTDSLIRVI